MDNREEQQYVWKEVDVKDELPPLAEYVFVIDQNKYKLAMFWNNKDERQNELEQDGITHWLKRVLLKEFTEEQIKDLSPRDAGFYKLGFEAAINSIK